MVLPQRCVRTAFSFISSPTTALALPRALRVPAPELGNWEPLAPAFPAHQPTHTHTQHRINNAHLWSQPRTRHAFCHSTLCIYAHMYYDGCSTNSTLKDSTVPFSLTIKDRTPRASSSAFFMVTKYLHITHRTSPTL